MPDSSAYYAALRQEQARLDKLYPSGFVFVVSVNNPNAGSTPGTVSHVNTRIAAKHLCEATAEIASTEQVREFLERGKAFAERMQAVAHANHKRNDASGVVHILRDK